MSSKKLQKTDNIRPCGAGGGYPVVYKPELSNFFDNSGFAFFCGILKSTMYVKGSDENIDAKKHGNFSGRRGACQPK